jgi:perosamine synthetase
MGTWLCHERLGFNYRLDEMSAALGFSQLLRIEQLLERRRSVAACYSRLLGDVSGIKVLSPSDAEWGRSWFVFIIRLEEGISRRRVIAHLQNRGIPTRTYFTPIHLQPYLQERFGYREGDFPVAERVAGPHPRFALSFQHDRGLHRICSELPCRRCGHFVPTVFDCRNALRLDTPL